MTISRSELFAWLDTLCSEGYDMRHAAKYLKEYDQTLSKSECQNIARQWKKSK